MKSLMLAVMCIVTSLTGVAQETSKTKQNISLAGTWTRDVKNWVFQFEKDGTFKSLSSDHSGTWTILDGDKVQMNWLSGSVATGSRIRTYTLQNENEFSGNNQGLGRESFKKQVVAVDVKLPSAEDSNPAKPADPDIARQPSIEDSKPAKSTDPDLSRQPTNEVTVASSDWTPNSGGKIKRDALNVLYTNALAQIELDSQKKKGMVLGQYEKKLDVILAAVRTKGDLDGYKLVKQESDRFRAARTIDIDAKPTHPDLALAISEYQKQFLTIDSQAKGQASDVTKKYINALRELVKQLVIQEKIEDAGRVNDEIKLLSGMIPEPMVALDSKKNESSGSRQPKEILSWRDITGTFEGGKRLAVGVVLQGKGMESKSSYRPPVEIEYVCKTDSSNIRISYACTEMIFNWEGDMTSLRVDGGPASKQHRAGAGKISPNQFVTIRQVVLPDKMEIYVDDELRASWEADFSKINSPIGIRSPDFPRPPIITIKSVRIRMSASNGITGKSSGFSESSLGNDDNSKLKKSWGMNIREYSVAANNPQGTSIGRLKKGEKITIEYASGGWTGAPGGNLTSPDLNGNNETAQLCCIRDGAMVGVCNIPKGTKDNPFEYECKEDGIYCLRKGDHAGQYGDNSGKVKYKVGLPPGLR